MRSHQKSLVNKLRTIIKGEVLAGRKDLSFYSHDASLFELRPQVVVQPRDAEDVCNLVSYVAKNKATDPTLSLTPRSGGTDMTGGAISDSIVVAFGQHFKAIGRVQDRAVGVQPGVYYREFEPVADSHKLMMPSYPASKDICMIGGMVANNSGGEKSLVYGKTDKYVKSLKIVLADGKEHTIQPLTGSALKAKLKEPGIEGRIYRQIYELLTQNAEVIKKSRPRVSKNSTGYNVWDAWNGKTLDLTKLIVGAQGTLGLVTETTFRLVPSQPLSGMLVAFLPNFNRLAEIINLVLPHKPTSLESFDRRTLVFAFRFFFSFRKTLGWKHFIWLGISFIPVLRHFIRYLPFLPKFVLMIEFTGDNQAKIDSEIRRLQKRIENMGVECQPARDKAHEDKFWTMRRESFNLLRKNVGRRHTAPFIDDLIVPPKTLPEFLPKLEAILDKYKLSYATAGHMGDGNFHIIPLMNLRLKSEREKIPKVLQEVINLVLQYDGSLTGEHNDGLIRGPFLDRMYDPAMIRVFKKVKDIFDPKDIFNPHKKITASWEYSSQHVRRGF